MYYKNQNVSKNNKQTNKQIQKQKQNTIIWSNYIICLLNATHFCMKLYVGMLTNSFILA